MSAYIMMLRDTDHVLTDNQRFAIAEYIEKVSIGAEAPPVVEVANPVKRIEEPHEYVPRTDRDGCGVCGYGVGAARHNLSEINRVAREKAMPQPQHVLEYIEVNDHRHTRRLSLLAAPEFQLVAANQHVRHWFDPVDDTHYKEVLHADHSQWFQELD
jgi:hypothetical protein